MSTLSSVWRAHKYSSIPHQHNTFVSSQCQSGHFCVATFLIVFTFSTFISLFSSYLLSLYFFPFNISFFLFSFAFFPQSFFSFHVVLCLSSLTIFLFYYFLVCFLLHFYFFLPFRFFQPFFFARSFSFSLFSLYVLLLFLSLPHFDYRNLSPSVSICSVFREMFVRSILFPVSPLIAFQNLRFCWSALHLNEVRLSRGTNVERKLRPIYIYIYIYIYIKYCLWNWRLPK
jgi:hypothetical protein